MGANVRPVSYTHLDVYKRQVQEKIADLEADVQRREDFVGAFTHELKTPMTSILGYADVLRTLQTDPEEQREAANAIYQESRRLEALSQKLLALLALGDEPVRLEDVELAGLWPRLRAACPGAELRTPAGSWVVRGDADPVSYTHLDVYKRQDIVFNYADEISVLREGELIASGTPEEIKQNEYVQQAYLGGDVS